MSDCQARGGCVWVKVRPEDEVRHCKDCGHTEPAAEVLNEGDEKKASGRRRTAGTPNSQPVPELIEEK